MVRAIASSGGHPREHIEDCTVWRPLAHPPSSWHYDVLMNQPLRAVSYPIAVTLCLYSAGCTRTPAAAPSAVNTVVAYLRGAELQAETNDQRREVLRALDDLLDKSPAELRNARYSDTSGHKDTRTVIEMLRAHFVPEQPTALDPERFYQDVATPEARSVIQMQRERVRAAIGLDE